VLFRSVTAEQLIPVAEAARILGISYVQVGNHIRAGKIRALKVGRAYVVDPQSVVEFQAIRRKPGNPNFFKKSS
jgi:excisionase family DNA binding protein